MTDNRRNNRGNPGNRGGGRPRLRKTLVINGVIQDGHWTVVSVTPETIVIEEARKENEMSIQEQIQATKRLEAEAKRLYNETGRPYSEIEDEVFAAFWSANPDWSPEAVSARKTRGTRVNSDNEYEDQ
jgi:hypothetical protein